MLFKVLTKNWILREMFMMVNKTIFIHYKIQTQRRKHWEKKYVDYREGNEKNYFKKNFEKC